MKYSLTPLLLIFLSSSLYAQTNIFLSREFWKSQPTLELITDKIKEGNDPSEANANNFDGVVYALLEDAPIDILTFLIEQEGNSVNKLTHDGRTYIFWAAYKGRTDIMTYLLKNGADTSLKDDKGYSILNFAAAAGQRNLDVYELCLANGIDLNTDLTPDGANALLLASTKDSDFYLINYFQSKGLQLNAVDFNGNGVFNYVSSTGHIPLLEKLIDLDVKTDDQAFLFAAYGSRAHTNGIEVYQYLKSQGLNANTANAEGVTPLHIVASRNKNLEVINFLLNENIDVAAQDKQGNTAFLNAVSSNTLAVVEVLANDGNPIDYKNKNGETALMLAVQNNKPDVVTFLLNKGANVNEKDKLGNTLVYYLIQSYTKKSANAFELKLKLLNENGLVLNTPQSGMNTWYHLTVEKNSLELLNIASELAVDINTKNSEGLTALHLAAMQAQDNKLLKALVALGADANLTTDFQETAYDLAQENELISQHNISIEFLK